MNFRNFSQRADGLPSAHRAFRASEEEQRRAKAAALAIYLDIWLYGAILPSTAAKAADRLLGPKPPA